MRHARFLLSGFALAGLFTAACQTGTSDRILAVDATGMVTGDAFIDLDGNGQRNAGDAPATGLRIWIAYRGARDTVASATTGADGQFSLPAVPVGHYALFVDSAAVGDSVRVNAIAPQEFTVAADSTVNVLVTVTFPTVSVAAARSLPVGRRIFIQGVALNGWGNFGDSTVHVQDATGTIRASRVRPANIVAGDTVRLLGAVGQRDGQPTLTDAAPFIIGPGVLPTPLLVTSATAATAGSGSLDAQLVRISQGGVLDSHTDLAGDIVLTVDDGSGTLDVILDRSAGFTAASTPLPGAVLEAVGLLVPSPDTPGRWQFKPRAPTDITVSFPVLSIAQARQQPLGKRVSVEGIALNGWATFADSTIHVRDATGAIRTVRIRPANVFAGDSIRILGTVSASNGQPLLSDGVASVLAQTGRTPSAQGLSTGQARYAVSGLLDADLAHVTNATISDTATVAGDFRMTVDDGSGPLTVVIDRDLGLRVDIYNAGVRLDVTGVLIPLPGGVWELKPRSVGDITIR